MKEKFVWLADAKVDFRIMGQISQTPRTGQKSASVLPVVFDRHFAVVDVEHVLGIGRPFTVLEHVDKCSLSTRPPRVTKHKPQLNDG